MPYRILKSVIDYCIYNKKFFALIVVLLFFSALFQSFVAYSESFLVWILLQTLVFVVVSGYGMLITRSRIRHGVRLPKIEIKKIIVLGIKSSVVMGIYFAVQSLILGFVSAFLNFPAFDLEDMLLEFPETLHMLYSHNPVETIIFVVAGIIIFYITTFFMEIALAKLADTNSFLSAFDLKSIKRSIDVVGWRNYAKEYTMIIFVIVALSYVASQDFPFVFLDLIVSMILSFIIFVTQYFGIGKIYCEIKELESKMS
ncbi:DUF4013 domain-containing protein [Methanobrevibacter sp.]|uniref:DUF4013 domain-containing protein n=1 Tax=Methanobrevibacter sp. TaxID=66852 RepID=UPI0038655931